MSRPGEDNSNCFQGKITAIMGASPGPLGGMRMLPELRNLLCNIAMHGTHVIPKQFSLSGAGDEFDDNGNLKGDHPLFEATIKQFVEMANKLK